LIADIFEEIHKQPKVNFFSSTTIYCSSHAVNSE